MTQKEQKCEDTKKSLPEKDSPGKAPPALGYDTNVRVTVPNYDLFHCQTIQLAAAYAKEKRKADDNILFPARWLDTGCGTGNLILKARTIYPDCKFTLADPSVEMLQIAKQKLLPAESEPNFEMDFRFVNLKTNQLDPIRTFSGQLFDIVTAVLSHHYLSQEERIVAAENCFRLLTSGGIYITFEHTAPVTTLGKEIGQRMVANFQADSGKNEKDIENYKNRYGKEYFPITVAQHMDMLKDAGFKTVELFWYSYLEAGFYAVK
ncbi:class I SAM-dependent methyltransferase [Methanolapillus ohkumae]|uniref:Carboxy-S-adenosyl-L-methionine synthase n=1 Tax=Methanolapillus ohkumae TaxID=3028298 RepID=A0AA96V737_9EURY|nr:Carboxy-S-adenosyl-L-methionine synthase [Methanosarcinaceae archaeon Am2]